jgi:porphobilinogen synthase
VLIRPRRNRSRPALRRLVRETRLSVDDLVLPLFVQEGEDVVTPIASMPGHARLSIDRLVEKAGEAAALGIPGIALFPVLADAEKDPRGSAAAKPDGLLQRCVRAVKSAHPELLAITDVALDPYSSDGHDGVLVDGRIDNDETLPLLAEMAVAQADAGADVVAPSDMMDGRVMAIRSALDAAGHTEVAIGLMPYSSTHAPMTRVRFCLPTARGCGWWRSPSGKFPGDDRTRIGGLSARMACHARRLPSG